MIRQILESVKPTASRVIIMSVDVCDYCVIDKIPKGTEIDMIVLGKSYSSIRELNRVYRKWSITYHSVDKRLVEDLARLDARVKQGFLLGPNGKRLTNLRYLRGKDFRKGYGEMQSSDIS